MTNTFEPKTGWAEHYANPILPPEAIQVEYLDKNGVSNIETVIPKRIWFGSLTLKGHSEWYIEVLITKSQTYSHLPLKGITLL